MEENALFFLLLWLFCKAQHGGPCLIVKQLRPAGSMFCCLLWRVMVSLYSVLLFWGFSLTWISFWACESVAKIPLVEHAFQSNMHTLLHELATEWAFSDVQRQLPCGYFEDNFPSAKLLVLFQPKLRCCENLGIWRFHHKSRLHQFSGLFHAGCS